MIPRYLHHLFWDIDPVSFSPTDFPDYTISRVLEWGDSDAVRWLKAAFSQETIERVVRHDRSLSRRSANFWALVYRIPGDQVAALRRSCEPPISPAVESVA